LLLPGFNVACDYGAPSEVVNGIATVTVQSSSAPDAGGADFSQYLTFTITPVIQVQDNTSGVNHDYTKDASSIIPKIQTNMVSRGYQYIASPPLPQQPPRTDLVIALYAYLGSQTYGGVYCDWWYWYYPYGCYPTYGYVGSYNYGTFLMQMGDFKNAPPPNTPQAQVGLIWNAAVYGVLGTPNYNLNNVLNGIDQAFAQSPYIHR
jgi:hypothetical protein